jgi:hypothetical protein
LGVVLSSTSAALSRRVDPRAVRSKNNITNNRRAA